MIVLGIDTSGILGGAALARAGRLVGETRCDARAAASERIVSQIDRLLEDLGATRTQIARIGVAIGPGSFTGLRVGLGTAKGLATGLGVPICPVSSLAARIHALGLGAVPVLFATAERRGEVFCGLGCWEAGGYRELLPETSRPLANAAQWLAEVREATAAARPGLPLICAGDAAAAIAAAAEAAGGQCGPVLLVLGAAPGAVPGAVALIAAAANDDALIVGAARDEIEPRYLRGADVRRPGGGPAVSDR